MEELLNGLGIATILTALYILRFRGWKRPVFVAVYFLFFLGLESVASHYFLPPGAMGPGLAYVCFGLTVPVLLAAYFVRRHELIHGEGDESSA